jgi:hypothetical protein
MPESCGHVTMSHDHRSHDHGSHDYWSHDLSHMIKSRDHCHMIESRDHCHTIKSCDLLEHSRTFQNTNILEHSRIVCLHAHARLAPNFMTVSVLEIRQYADVMNCISVLEPHLYEFILQASKFYIIPVCTILFVLPY